jgi:c-di-GMP-binding flagellar brake protein YcgR
LTPSSPSDKRIAPRFPVRIHVRFRLLKSPVGEPPEPELHNGNNLMSNISRTGFFLATKNFLEVESILEIEFPLEDFKEVVRAEAEVVRANFQNNPNQGRYEYGLMFTNMHPHFRQVLDQYFKLAGG